MDEAHQGERRITLDVTVALVLHTTVILRPFEVRVSFILGTKTALIVYPRHTFVRISEGFRP